MLFLGKVLVELFFYHFSKGITQMKRFSSKHKRPGKAAAFAIDLCHKKLTTKNNLEKNTPTEGYSVKIQKLEEELNLLTSYSSDTVYRLRYDTMKYDYVSPAVTRLLGFSPEEMKKVHFRSLLVETKLVTDGMRTVESFDELEAKRRAGDVSKWQADYLMRTKDGRKFWVSDVSYPWFDESGNVIGSVGSLRDITDRVEAENAIREEMEKLANTDSLTNLANRRKFFSEMDLELRRINRSESEVAILLLDIDHFKKINDTYGHDVGDRLLIEMSDVIKSCLRDTDTLARLGGEEFGVILPDTPAQGAFWVGERMRTKIMNHDFSTGSDKSPVKCSISVGVASAAYGDKADSSELFKTADTRLYIAKNTGRNQVSIDEIIQTH